MLAELFASDFALVTLSALLGVLAGVLLTNAIGGALSTDGGVRKDASQQRTRRSRRSDGLRHDPEFR